MAKSKVERILKWATENVRKPWERVCEVAHELSEQRILSEEQAMVRVPLAPLVTIDWRAAYHFMRDVMGLLLWDPANLFSIILSEDGSKILRAYIEETRDNNFVSLTRLDPDEDWLKEALAMIQNGRLYELRWFLDEQATARGLPHVNWVKIAHIQFFYEFKKVIDAYEKDKKIATFVREALFAVQNIYKNGWIMFSPEPPTFARLRQLITEILEVKTKDGRINLQGILGEDKDVEFGPVAVALRGRGYTTSLLAKAKDGEIHIRRVEVEGEENLPLDRLAKSLKAKTGAKFAAAMRMEPVANLLFASLYPSFPWDREEFKTVVRRALEIVRNYGDQVAIAPEPIFLRSWVRKTLKFLRFPYELSRLSSWYLPQVIVDGYQTFLGQNFTRAFAVLDGDKLVSLTTVEFWRGGIKKLKILEPADYQHIFDDLPETYAEVKDRIKRLHVELWEREGWVDLVLCVNKDLFKALAELSALGSLKNPFALPKFVKALKKVRSALLAGKLIAYPDRMFVELENWVKERGRIGIYRILVKLAFDSYRPKRRGLLYVRATAAAAVIVLAIIGLLVVL